MHTTKKLPEFSGQVIVLNGTGTLSEVKALFNKKFQLIDGRIKITVETHLIRRGLGKTKCLQMKTYQFKKLMQDSIRFLRPQDQKILIATHMKIEKDITAIATELLPDRQIESIHFYGNRGINEYQNFDAIICFGQPGTNQAMRFDEAILLYDSAEDRIEWFQHKADAEALQTIHRIRPINGNKNIIFLNRKWLPELGQLNSEIDTRNGSDKITHSTEKAYKRIERFYKIHGFMTLEIMYALRIGHISRKDII